MTKKIPDMSALPVLSAIGFTSASLVAYITAHESELIWWIQTPGTTDEEKRANVEKVFDAYVANGPQNAGTADLLSHILGFPAPWVRAVIAEFDAAVRDVAIQDGLL